MKIIDLLETSLQTQFRNIFKKYKCVAYGKWVYVPFSNEYSIAVVREKQPKILGGSASYQLVSVNAKDKMSKSYTDIVIMLSKELDRVFSFKEDERTLEGFEKFFKDIQGKSLEQVKKRLLQLDKEYSKKLGD